ncbi:hypothetical protein ACS0TY_004266 [Phlomoides rotata]
MGQTSLWLWPLGTHTRREMKATMYSGSALRRESLSLTPMLQLSPMDLNHDGTILSAGSKRILAAGNNTLLEALAL